MADYISREDAIKKITEAQDKAMTGIEDVTYYRAIKIIREMPTANVQTVKCGQWKEVIQCSNCNFTLNGTSYGYIVHKYFSYCPNCGADMRKKVEVYEES